MSFSAIFIVRVRNGKEKEAALEIKDKSDLAKRPIHSVLVVENVPGYIFVEGEKHAVEKTMTEISQYRAKIIGKTNLEEISRHLTPKPTIEGVETGDIVEIISGPFRGSRAKIATITLAREELTVELLDSRHTIPIVIHADFVRKVQSAADGLLEG